MNVAASPRVATRHDSTRTFSGVAIADDIDGLMSGYRSGNWIDAAIGGVATSLDALALITDPLGQLVSWGVGWLIEHVRPLSDALDALAGDPDQIAAYAQTWRSVAATSRMPVTTCMRALRATSPDGSEWRLMRTAATLASIKTPFMLLPEAAKPWLRSPPAWASWSPWFESLSGT